MDKKNGTLLEMRSITKMFPGVVALDNVSIKVEAGTVHGLIGENGAGKSTLMKVLIGLYHIDGGEILLRGEKVRIGSPKEALAAGISMIHQELNPIPQMTIAENIYIGREPVHGFVGVANRKAMRQSTNKLLAELGLDFDPDTKLKNLNVAETQMVEIMKAVSYNADIIIMDEPSSALSDREIEKLFLLIRRLVAKGTSVIYISHKLDELFSVADTITVLRDGRFVDSRPIAEITKPTLISLMVGREISAIFPKENVEQGEVVLEIEALSLETRVQSVSFSLRKGEILGIAGLMGAGRTELVETIFGLRKATRGTIRIKGKETQIRNAKMAIASGIAFVTEDRKLYGLNLKMSVKANITLSNLAKYCLPGGFVNRKAEKYVAKEQIQRFEIKTHSMNQIVNTLSGGNQQKVVIAKSILTDPNIIILDEPTRGIDVGAKSEIHKLMVRLAKEGKAILMISSELPEIMGMSDRVIVLHEGRVTGEFFRDEFSQERIMACATGHLKGEF